MKEGIPKSEGAENKKVFNDRLEQFKSIVEKLPTIERVKSEREMIIISEADNVTSAVIARYGRKSKSINPEKLHLVPQEEWPGGHSFMVVSTQEAILVEQPTEDKFKKEVIHEMFHLKGSNFLPLALTEAIVERLTNEALNLDDMNLKGEEIFNGGYSYPEYLLALDSLLEKIVANVSPDVTNRVHAFSFFVKSHISGNLQYIDFLDEIFGSGTTEELNNLSDDLEDLVRFINRLNPQ